MPSSGSETVAADDPLIRGILDRWDEQDMPADPWPFMAFCSIGRLRQLIDKALEAELKPLGLTRSGFFALTTLALVERRCTRLSTLSRLLMVHPTTVKLTVDHLEADGLVRRKRHPTDRRATLVELTEAGLERAGAANAALSAGKSGLLGTQYRDLVNALSPLRLAAGDVEL